MKKMIVKWIDRPIQSGTVKPNGLPKNGDIVVINQTPTNDRGYCDLVGFEYDAVGTRVEFHLDSFIEPNLSEMLANEAIEHIEKETDPRKITVPQIERVFALDAEF